MCPDPDKWRDVMTLSFIEHRIKELARFLQLKQDELVVSGDRR